MAPTLAAVQVPEFKACFSSDTTNHISDKDKKRSFRVRVLVADISDAAQHKPESWKLSSPQGFILVAHDTKKKKRFKISKPEIDLCCKNGEWHLGNVNLRSADITISSPQELLVLNGTVYHGSFRALHSKKHAMIINSLDLEDYVLSVLHSEGWPGWPLEVDKVLAVAIRSYTASMIYDNTRRKLPYHVRNTNSHQVYKGKSERSDSAVLRAAIDETRGMILVHNNKPILAMYDTCCGGAVPSLMQTDVDFVKAPYLARSSACHFCKKMSLYQWKVEFAKSDLVMHLKGLAPSLGVLKDIKILKKDAAGIVHTVQVKGSGGQFTLNAKKLYSVLPKLRSCYFTISQTRSNVIFSGNGYGHLIGLCQWGAYYRVLDGGNYKSILGFYYPKTQLKRLV